MAAVASPSLFSATESIVGPPILYAGSLQMALADFGDASEPFLPFFADLTGTGIDTIRQNYASGMGGGNLMTSRSSETAVIVPTGYTHLNYTGSIASYVLGFSQSRHDMTMSLPGQSIQADQAGMLNAQSAATTLHYLMAVAAVSISAAKGTSGAAANINAWFQVIAHFDETAGFEGTPFAWLHPEQITDLRTSLNSYTGYQFPAEATRIQSLFAGAPANPWLNLFGINIFKSTRVQESGGDWQGWVQAPGKFGRLRARPAVLPDLLEIGRDDNFGIVTTQESSSSQSVTEIHTEMEAGIVTSPDALTPSVRFISVND